MYNIQTFIKELKTKTNKQTNVELYNLMLENINDKIKYNKYRSQLIINNTRLVVKKVGEYIKSPKLMLFDDLVQEGIIGLTKSIDTYNPNLKYNFSTWAGIHIKKFILRHMDSLYMPRPHTQITENIDRIRKISSKLHYKLFRQPTAEEVKTELDKQMKQKSKLNKKLNKSRLKKQLSPLSEQIGIDKNGNFAGININSIRYILDIINKNCIKHSINLEQGSLENEVDILDQNIDNNYINDIHNNLLGNVFYQNMYEEVISIISELPQKNAEIIDMLFGISYERPYTLREIQTVLYNPLDKKQLNSTIPAMNRLVKMCIGKLNKEHYE